LLRILIKQKDLTLALRKVYFGSIGPFVYDDALPINDPDGDFAGEDHKAMTTDGQLHVDEAPAADEEVIRLVDLGFRLLPPASVADIDNPVELNAITGDLGALILAYEVIGATGQNEYTIYAHDASGPAVNAPYIMDADGAGDERWIAITGKYGAQDLNISGDIILTGTVDGTDISVHVADADAHHAQSHDAASHSDIASTGEDIDDAVSKKHSQGTDTSVGALTVYADNAAAVAGGLAVNDLYRNGADPDLVCVVH